MVDPSLNVRQLKGTSGGDDAGNDYSNVIFYSKTYEDLPVISRVGDIIRVHRANVRATINPLS